MSCEATADGLQLAGKLKRHVTPNKEDTKMKILKMAIIPICLLLILPYCGQNNPTEPAELEISEKVTAKIWEPDSGSIVSGIVLIGLYASSEKDYKGELSKVELYIGKNRVYFDTPSSDYWFYDYEWDTRSLEDNSLHSIKLIAFDQSGSVDIDEESNVQVIHNYYSEDDIEGEWHGKIFRFIDILTSEIDSIPAIVTVESDGRATGGGMNGIWSLDPERNGLVTGVGGFSFVAGSHLISCDAEWDLKLSSDKIRLNGSMHTTAPDPYDSWYLFLTK